MDIIKNKVKNNDSNPILNNYDASNIPLDQSYGSGGNYHSKNLFFLSEYSNDTNSRLVGGSFTITNLFQNKNSDFKQNHEIYLKKKTVVSDCIRIEVRCFQNSSKCKYPYINVYNFGNIAFDMYKYLNSNEEKSFNGLLKHYYRENNFGKENLKKNEFCQFCETNSLEYYIKMSTLPEILAIDFNWHKYYDTASDFDLKNKSFDWLLQEEISLLEHYDKNFSFESKIDYYYKLTSFIAHFGNRVNGHFINFSKIDNSWYYFDDLSKEPAFKIRDFNFLKNFINIYNLIKYKEKL